MNFVKIKELLNIFKENIFYFYLNNPISEKYRLHKINQTLTVLDLEEVKKLTVDYYIENNKFLSHSKNKELNAIIENFVLTMRKNFDDETLKNLYDNIKWVIFKKFNSKKHNGEYLSATNVIRLVNEKRINTINHELLHMSSNPYDDTNNFGGLFYTVGKYKVGYGLDEGYTELLNKRYFNSDSEIYKTEVSICLFLEELVGQKKMEKMYLTANLYGLIQDLKETYEIKEIERFFASLDYINDYNYRNMISDIELENLFQQVEFAVLFLFKGFCERLTDKTMPEDLLEMDIVNYLLALFNEVEFQVDEESINKINLIIEEKLNKNIKLNINMFKQSKNVL